MKLSDIINEIKKVYPEFLQYDWDNSGLNIGCHEKEIKKIMTTLEITSDTVDEAIKNRVDLIVSHHPFLFSKINCIDSSDYKGNLIFKLIKNDISVYCMHTNYDIAFNGLNDYFFEILDINNCGILDTIGSNNNYNDGKPFGLGRIGKLKNSVKAKEFINRTKEILKIDFARFVGDLNKNINTVAIVTGSGAEYFDFIKDMNIDMLITGDMKYHQAVDAYELGVNVLDLGHYGTEYIFSDSIEKYLKNNFSNIDVIKSEKMLNPFKTM